MAPEIIEMEGGGVASDIWSLGCTILELLTGVPPYFDLTTMQALFNIVEDKHPPIPDSCSPVRPIKCSFLWDLRFLCDIF